MKEVILSNDYWNFIFPNGSTPKDILEDGSLYPQILNRYFPDFSGRHFLIRYKDGNTPSPYIPLFMPAPEPFSVAKQFSS